MSYVTVAKDHLTFNGLAYFRGHAEEVEIGSIGVKRKPPGRPNYLEVKDKLPISQIAVARATVAKISFKKTTSSSFTAAISAIVNAIPVKLSGAAAFEKLHSGELELVKFSVLSARMKTAANDSPAQLQELIAWNDRARIAHQVFVVMEASLANTFSSNARVDLSVKKDIIEASVGGAGTSSGTTTIKISRGTCFAYLLLKIKWDAAQKKKRSKIVDLSNDQWGIG